MNSFHRQISSVVITLLVGGMALLPMSATAEDNTPKKATHSLAKGARALQFAIDSNFTLRSFSGSTITYKRHTRSNVAWRIGVTAFSDFNDFEREELRDSLSSDYASDNKNASIELELVRIKYGSVAKRTTFFWGVGPQVFYRYVKSVTDRTYTSGNRILSTTRQNWYTVGLSGIVGVEWFMNSKLSLSAEYRSELVYNWNDVEVVSTQIFDSGAPPSHYDSESKRDGIRLSSEGVMFGLSVYF